MLNIRLLKRSDLSSCAALYVLSFNSEPWNDKWTKKAAMQRLKDIFNTPRFYGIVCMEKKKIIGALLGNIECWYEKYHYNLKEMYIDPNYQRRGLGSKMIKKLRSDLKKRKVKGIYLFTSSEYWPNMFYTKKQFLNNQKMHMMNVEVK